MFVPCLCHGCWSGQHRLPDAQPRDAAHLTLPRRQPSLGIVHPGRRPAGQIILHEAAQPWLRSLLARFDACRAAIAGPRGANRYVFVSSRGRIRDVPVSSVFVWDTVRRATCSIVGFPCNPNTLRKTATVYFADRIGAGILSRLGLEAQQTFAYSWMTREVLNPVNPL